MRVNLIIVLTVCVLQLMLFGVLQADAAPSAFRGVFVSYKGDDLTLMNRSGDKESYRVTKDTQVMSRAGDNIRLEVTRPGTRVSVTAQGRTAQTVIILEVPK